MTEVAAMPDHARIWIYQSTKPFSTEERAFIERNFDVFVSQWAAHGQKLQATYSIEKNQFIILAVDESYHGASGCSIDSSVAVVRGIEQATGLSLLDRTQVAYFKDGEVKLRAFNKIKEAVQTGEIAKETLVFNNSVQNAGDWKDKWTQPAGESWLSRYFA